MKKAILAVLAVALALTFVPAGIGWAQGSIDLGVESVGLLPPNPFYFLKEWGRGFRSLFASAIRKTRLEMDVLNEKAAEIKKLEEITSGDTEALTKAAETYAEGAARLKARLMALRDTSSNPNVDQLLNDLLERLLKHQQLFDDLRAKFDTESVQDAIADILSTVAYQMDSPGKFLGRFEGMVNARNDEFREIRAAQLADRLEEKLLGQGPAYLAIAALKENLLIKFSGRLEGLGLSEADLTDFLEQLPGSRLRLLRLLDEIRENITDPNLKNGLNLLRQRILDERDAERGISEAEARQAIEAAQFLINETEAKIAERKNAVKQSIKELAERARFNLSQAEEFFATDSFGAAFGQAIAAQAEIRAAWLQLMPSPENQIQSLEIIKQQYDALADRVREAGLTKEDNPKLFQLLTATEKRIVELSKLMETKGASEAIADLFKNVKMALATIEELLK